MHLPSANSLMLHWALPCALPPVSRPARKCLPTLPTIFAGRRRPAVMRMQLIRMKQRRRRPGGDRCTSAAARTRSSASSWPSCTAPPSPPSSQSPPWPRARCQHLHQARPCHHSPEFAPQKNGCAHVPRSAPQASTSNQRQMLILCLPCRLQFTQSQPCSQRKWYMRAC